MQIPCVAESSLWTHFLEAFVEDMLTTAYVDAYKLFLAVPFFACQETSEKDPTEWLFLCNTVSNKRHINVWDAGWFAAFAFSVPASYH